MASAHIPELRSPEGINRDRPRARGARLRVMKGGQPTAVAFAALPASVGDLLDPGMIAPRISAVGRRQVLSVIAEMAARGLGVKAPVVFDGLMEREAAGSTGIGHGVAIPHARIAGLSKLRGVFVRLSAPVEFHAVDDQPVDLIFALLAPLDCGSERLRALARVARLLRDRDLRQKLRTVPSAAAIRAILAQEAQSSAV